MFNVGDRVVVLKESRLEAIIIDKTQNKGVDTALMQKDDSYYKIKFNDGSIGSFWRDTELELIVEPDNTILNWLERR